MEGKGMTAEQSSSPGENGEQSDHTEQTETRAHGGELAPLSGANSPAAGNEPGMSEQSLSGRDAPRSAWGTPDEETAAPDSEWQRPRVRVDGRLLEATLLNLQEADRRHSAGVRHPGCRRGHRRARASCSARSTTTCCPGSASPPRRCSWPWSAQPARASRHWSTASSAPRSARRASGGPPRTRRCSPATPTTSTGSRRTCSCRRCPGCARRGWRRPGRDGLLVLAASEGMTQGDRPARHPGHRLRGARALRLRLPVPRRLGPVAVHDEREPGTRTRRSGNCCSTRGSGAPRSASSCPGSRRATAPSSSPTSTRCSTPTASRPRTGSSSRRPASWTASCPTTSSSRSGTGWTTPPSGPTGGSRCSARRWPGCSTRSRSGCRGLPRTWTPRWCSAPGCAGRRRPPTRPRSAEFDEGTRDGRLLAGEVLARWQDYAASGDLGAALRGKRGRVTGCRRGGKRARTDAAHPRYAALETALRSALQALVVSVADRAAEQVARVWRDNPGGAALLAAADASRVRDERAKREFESAFGHAVAEAGGCRTCRSRGLLTGLRPTCRCALSRAVSAWQDQLMRLTQSEVARRPGAAAVPRCGPGQRADAGRDAR